jgi:hypothetical protein
LIINNVLDFIGKFRKKYLIVLPICWVLQCGKPYFSNTRQNEIELAMFGE